MQRYDTPVLLNKYKLFVHSFKKISKNYPKVVNLNIKGDLRTKYQLKKQKIII